jgi:general nucleoside transport system permease protein
MLVSAFAAATVAALCNSAWIALAAGIVVAGLFALVHGYACITQRGNQVVSGIALNMLAAGLTVALGNAWFHRGGETPTLSAEARFMPSDLPGAAAVHDVPVLGPLYEGLIGGHNLIVYAALASVPLTHWLVGRTRFGLRLRAVGENPQAIDTAGISVAWLRYRAVLLCGLFTGIAGTYLAIAQNAGFSRDMTAGQGYMALAALIFGKWRPYGALGASLMFGLLDAIAIRLQGVRVVGVGEGSGAADPGDSLPVDCDSACRLHRQGGRPQGGGHTLRQGAMNGRSRAESAVNGHAEGRVKASPPGSGCGSAASCG